MDRDSSKCGVASLTIIYHRLLLRMKLVWSRIFGHSTFPRIAEGGVNWCGASSLTIIYLQLSPRMKLVSRGVLSDDIYPVITEDGVSVE